ncbi:MAG: diguanylate cyclase [Thermodesulfobacteriota bacterium]|nr:diguanylate cyclase [Thermodesulfobacteriota bacterium]
MDSMLSVDYEKEIGSPFTDSLTGLFNHGFFQISLMREIKRSERHGPPLALALIDIDFFALFNKHHGAVCGDRVLKKIAGLIMKNLRQVDLAARYSGDVLAVILANADTHSALEAVERIRQSVEILYEGTPTVSVGLASFPSDATSEEGLIEKAHEALLQAKIRGKNRVHCFENETKPVVLEKPKILVVDDEPRNAKLLEALLSPLDYEVIKALKGEEALSIVKKVELDVILLDVMMPGMDGYEVCRRLKGNETTRLIPVVLITALDDIEAKVRGIEAGADDFLTKPPNKVELLARVKSLINVKSLNNNLASIENVLFSLASAVEAKDAYTQGHIQRVANMAVALGRKIGISGRGIEAIRLGGILHDVGKIGVSEDILNKPGPLDPEEWDVMKEHPDAGYRICLPLAKNIGEALEVIRHHHEKLDGSGYPDGLKGDEISVPARVMAVVDIYDALVTDRPYRKGMPKGKALGILRQEAKEGKLDSEIVEHLTEMVG